MSNKIFIIFLGLILTVSCVEEFQVPNTVSGRYKSELVIQGRILSGEQSTFYLSMTSAFGDQTLSPAIEDAVITIIGQNGYETDMAEYDRIHNQYTINTVSLHRIHCMRSRLFTMERPISPTSRSCSLHRK